MRGPNGALRGLATIHLGKAPVLIAPPAVMQSSHIEKPAQQAGDERQGIPFKVLESRF